jgi:hypothetical protein
MQIRISFALIHKSVPPKKYARRGKMPCRTDILPKGYLPAVRINNLKSIASGAGICFASPQAGQTPHILWVMTAASL